jgi:glyoxylase-like metal-dependent hydrolase (beta-lactamase superfamily II)
MDVIELANRTIDESRLIASTNRVSNQLTEIAPGLAVIESFSHVWAVDTDDGLVLFDTSGAATAAAVCAELRRWSTKAIHSIVYTHGHVDHVGGAPVWLADAEARGHPRPRVIGHRAVSARLERYRATDAYNRAANLRQFGPSTTMSLAALDTPFVPEGTPEPDVVYDDELTIDIGGQRFVLHHGRGETDDHTWTEWVGHDTVLVGDFLTWVFPNCGNPQKVLRYPAEWAANLRRMMARRAGLVAPAHGLPVQGPDRIDRVLGTTAEALEQLVNGVIEILNADGTLHDALAEVRISPELATLPWLMAVYDEPEFVIRNIWRTYGGWWDGNPAHLSPPTPRTLADAVVAMAGGTASLVARALTRASAGDVALACELIEFAVTADPTDAKAHDARVQIYAARRSQARSLMSKGIYAAAVHQSAELAGIPVPPMSSRSVPPGGSRTPS